MFQTDEQITRLFREANQNERTTAVIVAANGDARFIQPVNGETFSYEELTAFVDGGIELVDLAGWDMYINSEGLPEPPNFPGKLINKAISKLVGPYIIFGDVIIGRRSLFE